MPTIQERPAAVTPDTFWSVWQELYDASEVTKSVQKWSCPALVAIRKVLWKCPEHISWDKFREALLDKLEAAVRSDFMSKTAGVRWITTIGNLDAWLTTVARNAAEDYRRRRIPGYRAKLRGSIVELNESVHTAKRASSGCDMAVDFCSLLRRKGTNESPRFSAFQRYAQHARNCETCLQFLEMLYPQAVEFLIFDTVDIATAGYPSLRLLNILGIRNSAIGYLLECKSSLEKELAMLEKPEHVKNGEYRMIDVSPGLYTVVHLSEAAHRQKIQELHAYRACVEKNLTTLGYRGLQTKVRPSDDFVRVLQEILKLYMHTMSRKCPLQLSPRS